MKFARHKRTKTKEKSLVRKFIDVAWEQAQRRKALRLLSKQEWSVDFLTALLVKASKLQKQGLELIVTSPNGSVLTVRSTDTVNRALDDSDDIYNHLDDPVAVDNYIARNGR